MTDRIEHEFGPEDNDALIGLSEELYRFSIMTGVVGLALIALGVAGMVTGGYTSSMSGPAFILMGLVATFGGSLFLRPKTSLDWISRTRGSDVTKLMDALRYLDRAHGVLLILLIAFAVARVVSFVLVRTG